MGCRSCGVVTSSHGRREHVLVGAPSFGRPVRLVWRKRTWSGPEPGRRGRRVHRAGRPRGTAADVADHPGVLVGVGPAAPRARQHRGTGPSAGTSGGHHVAHALAVHRPAAGGDRRTGAPRRHLMQRAVMPMSGSSGWCDRQPRVTSLLGDCRDVAVVAGRQGGVIAAFLSLARHISHGNVRSTGDQWWARDHLQR
jgi:hypothetical protein